MPAPRDFLPPFRHGARNRRRRSPSARAQAAVGRRTRWHAARCSSTSIRQAPAAGSARQLRQCTIAPADRVERDLVPRRHACTLPTRSEIDRAEIGSRCRASPATRSRIHFVEATGSRDDGSRRPRSARQAAADEMAPIAHSANRQPVGLCIEAPRTAVASQARSADSPRRRRHAKSDARRGDRGQVAASSSHGGSLWWLDVIAGPDSGAVHGRAVFIARASSRMPRRSPQWPRACAHRDPRALP